MNTLRWFDVRGRRAPYTDAVALAKSAKTTTLEPKLATETPK